MSPMSPEAEALGLFLHDAPARIARLSAPSLEQRLPRRYRPAAGSIARQAAGGWDVDVTDEPGFAVRSAMRRFRMGSGFGEQCRRVLDMITASRTPDLRAALDRIGGAEAQRAAVMAAFFHYFVSHEFLHIEQGLGSDQYKDSDSYMAIVMEADHVADVAGLVVTAEADIPEIAMLDMRDRVLLLVGIHVASMHSFDPRDGSGLDEYAFSRLLVWYLHFARFTKATGAPDFSSPTFARAWIVTLPRLVGHAERRITLAAIDRRHRKPYPAASDVVLAYHHEDGLYRIHRAALTDAERTRRLVVGIVNAAFDDVRVELEELLINNPALVPTSRRSSDVEWAAGVVIDELERLNIVAAADDGAPPALGPVREAYDRLRSTARTAAKTRPELVDLLDGGDRLLDELELVSASGDPSLPRIRRRILSLVDQMVLGAA